MLYAGCVAIGGRGVLIQGPSGSGKSDLALRLIDRGAVLVSDDQTRLRRDGDRLLASAPARIAGQIEVRGVGIVEQPFLGHVPVAMIAIVGSPDRLPEPAVRDLLGIAVPAMVIAALEPSAAIKLELALDLFGARQ